MSVRSLRTMAVVNHSMYKHLMVGPGGTTPQRYKKRLGALLMHQIRESIYLPYSFLSLMRRVYPQSVVLYSRSWCKAGAWASLDGKIGKVTMNPDSDSEVKLKWANGETSSYVKIARLKLVAGGKHPSHSHNVAPNDDSRRWYCDVCRTRCAQLALSINATVS